MQLNRTDLSEAPTPQLCVELDTAADRPTQIGINLGRGKAFLQEVNIKNLRERQGHYARDFLIGKKLDPKGDFLGGTGKQVDQVVQLQHSPDMQRKIADSWD